LIEFVAKWGDTWRKRDGEGNGCLGAFNIKESKVAFEVLPDLQAMP
jgi:hypothetical protein